jgi:uncharacterized membrane-anchored protein
MVRKMTLALLFLLLSMRCGIAQQATPPATSPKPTLGPARVTLGANNGQLQLPKGYVFLNAEEARRVMRESGDPDSKGLLGLVAEREGTTDWMALLSYDDCGYVKDDEADQMNADDLLEVIKKSTEASNEERVRMGGKRLEAVGWQKPPSYNRTTHTLSWSIIGREEGDPAEVVNHVAILLGRYGTMTCTVVGDLKDAAVIQPKLEKITASLMFTQGRDYTAFRSGDRISEMTMTGLVTGGAAAAAYGAAKGGLLAKLGALLLALKKGIVVILIAVAAIAKKLFDKVTGRKSEQTDSSGVA